MRIRAVFLTSCALALLLVPSAAHSARKVTITGGGWGHGIGMSQYGALGRAENGKSGSAIVKKYYTGTTVDAKRMPNKIRVGILQTRSSVTLKSEQVGSSDGKMTFTVRKEIIAKGGLNADWRVEVSTTGGLKLFKNGDRVSVDGVDLFGDREHPVVVHYEEFDSMVNVVTRGLSYAYGTLEFIPFPTSSCGGHFCIETVVSLPMQDYLLGLGEVPSSWPAGALEAQVLAARTYAFKKIQDSGQHRVPCLCAVLDSTLDQVYMGDQKRTASGAYWKNWKNAVRDTEDEVILYDNEPISALYSSSSGGYTENNENVWGGTPYPYLRGVRDTPDSVPSNPNHSWKVTMSFSEFSSKLSSVFGTGKLKRFVIKKPLGVSGRVTVVKSDSEGGVKIVGTSSTARASGWAIRGALGLRDTLFKVKISQAVAAVFQDAYANLDGAPGDAVSKAYDVPKKAADPLGEAQDFDIGRMTYNEDRDKVTWQWGEVLDEYDSLGREKSPLGLPRSGVWGPEEFNVARYDNGSIVWSTGGGAHAIVGAFSDVYKETGGVNGQLGVPIGDKKSTALTPGTGKLQRFDGGTIFSSSNGTFAILGRVDQKYREIGGGASDCGYPIAPFADGVGEFKHGTITNDHGTVTVDCS